MAKEIYTLGKLLDEIKAQTPKFEKGQFFETLKSVYPSAKISNDVKNIIIEGKQVTIPLACSSKAKRQFKKDNSLFFEFSKDNSRGDFLEIVETDGYTAKCINRSIKDDIREKYYMEEDIKYITITFNDILDNTVKRVYRGIKNFIN